MATKLAPLLVFLIFWHSCPSWELKFRWQQDYHKISFIAKSAKIASQYVNFFDLLFFGKSLHALFVLQNFACCWPIFWLTWLTHSAFRRHWLYHHLESNTISIYFWLPTFYLPKSNLNVINSNYKYLQYLKIPQKFAYF